MIIAAGIRYATDHFRAVGHIPLGTPLSAGYLTKQALLAGVRLGLPSPEGEPRGVPGGGACAKGVRPPRRRPHERQPLIPARLPVADALLLGLQPSGKHSLRAGLRLFCPGLPYPARMHCHEGK